MKSFRRCAALLGVVAAGAVLTSSCGATGPDALDSVFRVEVEQCGVVDHQLATAVAVEPDLAATVAHSLLEGVERLSLHDFEGREVAAEIVYLDGDKDVALLRLSGSTVMPLDLAEPVESGQVTIASAAGGDGPISKPAEILDLVAATLDGKGRRAAIRLDADIEPGDSGAAVVDDQGRMVGMVFATARNDREGWAVAMSEIAAAVERVNADRPRALPPAC